MKNYIGFVRDHSVSMRNIKKYAAIDYNSNIESIKTEAQNHNIDTIVSVVECGHAYTNKAKVVIQNSSVAALLPITESAYSTNGNGTPLFDSVKELIDIFQKVPDCNDSDVSFLIFVTTDGEENCSKTTGSEIAQMMKTLQATDRWTFVFRVPHGDTNRLTKFGIPPGNILEWEQTQKGVESATIATTSAMRGYYSARSIGATSTNKFYADLSTVSLNEVKHELVDISAQIKTFKVHTSEEGMQIRDFVTKHTHKEFVKGSAFYELSKLEIVQEAKQIAIRDKLSGKIYSGFAARDLLNIPSVGEITLSPGQHGNYDIFIQSTSVNRKLKSGTTVLIWINV